MSICNGLAGADGSSEVDSIPITRSNLTSHLNYFKASIASGVISGTYYPTLVTVNLETCIS
jgi:hypothetical protein